MEKTKNSFFTSAELLRQLYHEFSNFQKLWEDLSRASYAKGQIFECLRAHAGPKFLKDIKLGAPLYYILEQIVIFSH